MSAEAAPSSVQLRPATGEDVAAIAEIWRTGWADGHLGNVPQALVEARHDASFRTRAAQCISDTVVAVVDGEVAGFNMVVGDHVEQIYVAGAHRGAGIADALMADAERRIRQAGHTSAWLAVVPGNLRARRFYARLGWTDAGPFFYEAAGEHGPITVPAHRYVKEL